MCHAKKIKGHAAEQLFFAIGKGGYSKTKWKWNRKHVIFYFVLWSQRSGCFLVLTSGGMRCRFLLFRNALVPKVQKKCTEWQQFLLLVQWKSDSTVFSLYSNTISFTVPLGSAIALTASLFAYTLGHYGCVYAELYLLLVHRMRFQCFLCLHDLILMYPWYGIVLTVVFTASTCLHPLSLWGCAAKPPLFEYNFILYELHEVFYKWASFAKWSGI